MPVLVAERVRGTAALHRRLGVGNARIERRDRLRDVWSLTLDRLAVASELTVLEDDRLTGLIEHRHELEIRGELAVDGGDRLGESLAPLGIDRERTGEPEGRGRPRGGDRNEQTDDGHALEIVARPAVRIARGTFIHLMYYDRRDPTSRADDSQPVLPGRRPGAGRGSGRPRALPAPAGRPP